MSRDAEPSQALPEHTPAKILEIYRFDADIFPLLDPRSQFALRSGRAQFVAGSKLGMIKLDFA